MRIVMVILLCSGCAKALEDNAPAVPGLQQQLREAQEPVDMQENTDALLAIKDTTSDHSAVESPDGARPTEPPISETPAEPPIPEPAIKIEQPSQSAGPLLTLYTTDGSFPCGGCEIQQRIIAEAGIADGLISIVHVDGATASAMGGVPRWETYDKTTRASGVLKAVQLTAWLEMLEEHRGDSVTALATVTHTDPTFSAVMAALAVHLSDDAAQQPFGSLLNVDVDTPDEITAAVFEIVASGKWSSAAAGVAVSWADKARRMDFAEKVITLNPPAQVTLSKWKARWTSGLKAIQFDKQQKTVTLILSGAPDLTVRFK